VLGDKSTDFFFAIVRGIEKSLYLLIGLSMLVDLVKIRDT